MASSSTSKYHLNYWLRRVFFRHYKNSNGEDTLTNSLHVRLKHLGRREFFNLHSANKENAAILAKEIYTHLVSNGWESTLAKYRPETVVRKAEDPTFGELLAEIQKKAIIKELTLKTYITKFRTLIAQCFEIERLPEAYYHLSPEYTAWVEATNAIRLSKLTAGRIQAWKKGRLDEVKNSPLETKSAKRTINSILRAVQSLLAEKVLRHLDLKISVDFLKGVDLEFVPVSKYQSKIPDLDAFLLKAKEAVEAHEEAAKTPPEDGREKNKVGLSPEAFKILLLALGAGLRRNEIDKLTWGQIDFKNGKIDIAASQYGDLKTESSEGGVWISGLFLSRLKEYQKKTNSVFVVEGSDSSPVAGNGYYHYRCAGLFKELNGWLRTQGIKSPKPIHELRKEFGSLICKDAGIFAASRQLRHSSIGMTNAYYLDVKNKSVVNLPL